MTQTNEKYDSGYSETIEREISYFMSKKRRQVVETLYDKKKLSQGDLAQSVNTSAASLSNILLLMEKFKYKLVESESEGKRQYYFLTELGEKFVRNVYRNEQNPENDNVIVHDSFQKMKSVASCLEEIKNKYEDEWKVTLDTVLYESTKFRNSGIDGDGKEIDAFLNSIERVLVTDYEIYSVKILELMYPDTILLDRLKCFLEIYEIFIPVLMAWKKELNSLQMINFLESIVTCDKKKAEQYISQVQWEDGKYERLSDLIQYVIRYADRKEESEIYQYFNRFLAGEDMLAAILAKAVSTECKTRKEKKREDA